MTRGGVPWPLAAAALSAGVFLLILDALTLPVTLGDLTRDLGLDATGVQWTVDAYSVALGSLLLAAGAVADRIGARPVYLGGLAGFGIASAACALAPSGAALAAARALQGAAVAAMLPSSLALLRARFPDPLERAPVIAFWAAAAGVAGVIGPLAGGLAVELGGWRTAYLMNVPLCAVGVALALRLPPAGPGGPRAPFHAPSQAALMVGLAALVLFAMELPHRDPTDPLLAGAAAIALACAAAQLPRRGAHRPALLPPGFFASRTVIATTAIALLHNLAGYGTVFVLGLFLQLERGLSPLATGLALLPMPLAMTAVSTLSGRIVRRAGARGMLGAGMAIGALSTALLVGLDVNSPYALVGVAVAGIGVASGLSVPAMTAVMLVAVDEEHAGVAGAVLTAARQVGTALGVAAIGSVLTAAPTLERGLPDAMIVATAGFAAGAVIAVSWVRRLRRRDPEGQPAVVLPADYDRAATCPKLR